jgi:hypothetical protein
MSLTLLSSLLLLTTTHCREDDKIRRKAEGQKPHLKRKKTRSCPSSPESWINPPRSTRFCRVVASADFLINLNQSRSHVSRPDRSRFNNYARKHRRPPKRPFSLQKLLPPHWFSGLASIYYCETSTSKKVYETAQLRLPSELLLITQIMHCCIHLSDARAWGCNPTKLLVVLQLRLTELFTWLIKVHHTHNHMNL